MQPQKACIDRHMCAHILKLKGGDNQEHRAHPHNIRHKKKQCCGNKVNTNSCS